MVDVMAAFQAALGEVRQNRRQPVNAQRVKLGQRGAEKLIHSQSEARSDEACGSSTMVGLNLVGPLWKPLWRDVSVKGTMGLCPASGDPCLLF